MPFGASATQGDATHASYRRPLWQKLAAGGYSVDFVGSQRLNSGGPPPSSDFDLDHEGHWGLRTDELLVSTRQWADAARPDVVLLHAGSNDAFQNQNVTGTRDELGQIIDQLRLAQPTVQIILAQLLPTALSPGNTNINALNALLPDLAQQKSTPQSRVVIVDQNTGFDPATDMYDGVHLNATGEDKMSTRWYAALQGLLGPPPPGAYPLLLATTGSGSVARNPNLSSYPSGGGVMLTATPGPGQFFLNWSGDATGSTNPLLVSMTGAKSITANFAPASVTSYTLVNADTDQDIQPLTNGMTLDLATLPTRHLNVRANTNPVTIGSVLLELSGTEQKSQVESLTPYALFSDAGGDYNSWPPSAGSYRLEATAFSGAGGGGAASPPFVVQFSVVDQGSAPTFALTVGASGGGTVSKNPDKPTYVSGENVQLTATPAYGQVFMGWSGDATGTTNPLTLVMNSNKTVTAQFASMSGGPVGLGFLLVNADTDQDLQPLASGAVLDLATLPTQHLNIRLNSTATSGSVVFALTGAQTQNQTESVAPYALFSDSGGDYNSWTPPLGNYSLTATTYSGAGGQGTPGATVTVTFSVTTSQVLTITGFTLVNADTDTDIQPLTAGTTLNLKTLPTRNLNIRANTSPPTVGSVLFRLSGAEQRFQTESVVPYALFSDSGGDYNPWTPQSGSYSLTAQPYTEASGGGNAGQALTILFSVSNTANTGTASETPVATLLQDDARAYPNPSADGRYTLYLPQRGGQAVTYTLVSALGTQMATGSVAGNAGATIQLDFARYMQPQAFYYLVLESGGRATRVKLLRQ
ncbi:hypothetical protein E5K00_07880 [Hymenobacter aquaticus]|uniref:T9SS type A sorting domain-containing protein n=1 Tax=Hymenobacter aquaticus TaxID=1867101 RepID=A0A4Z0Q4Y6_9BACT|nr:GDSL-type esterase/lipase family protein [Hymenobacter aquaticus]TGE25107.1 hypothetical protein E5K00_07880 [Hymenobacter aquaticus]